MQLLESSGLGPEQAVRREAAEWFAAPQLQRRSQVVRRAAMAPAPLQLEAVTGERLEAADVDGLRRDLERVAAADALNWCVSER